MLLFRTSPNIFIKGLVSVRTVNWIIAKNPCMYAIILAISSSIISFPVWYYIQCHDLRAGPQLEGCKGGEYPLKFFSPSGKNVLDIV